MYDQKDLSWAFAPLNKVPLRTITRLVDKLRNSRDSGTRALGVFLDRVAALQGGRTSPQGAGNPSDPGLSSLNDLRE